MGLRNLINPSNDQFYAYLKVALVIVAILIVGLVTVGDQGISTDEEDDMLALVWNIKYLSSPFYLPNNVMYYGTVFPFLSEAVIQADSLITKGALSTRYFDSNASTDDYQSRLELRQRIKIKHYFTFLFSLLAYVAVAGLVGILVGPEVAWLGPLALVLTPRFWGHSSFNPRDIPFAAMFTLGTFLGVRLVGSYLRAAPEDIRLGKNRITLYSLLFSVLVALVTGTRLAGCFLLAFVGIAYLTTRVWKGITFKDLLRLGILFGIMLVVWFATVVAIQPISWANPFGWFFDSMNFLSRYKWPGSNLFRGQFIPGEQTPWYYLPLWFLIGTPEIILVLSLAGGLVLLFRYRKLAPIQRAGVIMVLLQIGFLPVVAILRNSTIYDAERQFLFIYPGMAILVAAALAWIFQRIPGRLPRLAAWIVCILLATPIVYDMISLHPYEMSYFNRAFGGLKAAQGRFDTEYAGLSMREGMEWINTHLGPGTRVVSSRELHLSETFALPSIEVISQREYDESGLAKPFYYLARPRFALQEKFPECPVIYAVMRQGVPFTIVKKCE